MTPGTKLGPYEITGAIGAGGMGEVYRARDSRLGRDVAIKVLPAAFARDAERMARFQREAKVLASLDHPNIASIYGLDDSSGTRALVMQLVEGPTLADRIKQGPIPIDEALRIAKQITEALEYAHERGIVHRDLKPANVKVSSHDAVKVLDFGLAKAIEGDAASVDISTSPTVSRMATLAGVLLGTAAYMSPEQAKAKPVDRRADIWAFGCVLYEMLTGQMAFSGETVTDTLAAVVRAEPEWSLLPSATPARVRVLLQRCFEKDPKQRLRDIGDARISIDEVLSGTPEQASPGAIGAGISAPLWRRVLPWALFGATAIAFTVLAFVHFRENQPAPAEPMRFEIPVPEKMLSGSAGVFALSPDGRELAFVAAGADGISRIWVRSIDSLEPRLVSGSESPAGTPFFWSPDNRYIAFGASGKLKTVDLSTGTVDTLCDVSGLVIGGSWNRDGVIVFGQAAGVIMRVSANGGSPTPVTSRDASGGQHVLPWFLPDGIHFLYHRFSSNPETTGIYVGSLDIPAEKQSSKRLLATGYGAVYVPSSDPNLGRLLYLTNDGTLMARPFNARLLELADEAVPVAQQVETSHDYGFFSASATGTLIYRRGSEGVYQLTWYDREGKALGTAGEPGDYVYQALSPDGSRAVAIRRDPQNRTEGLWMFDFQHHTNTRFTFGSADAGFSIWSPDGSRVIFESNPGRYDLYQKPTNGATGEELLLKSNETKRPSDVSRDGRFLLYISLDPKTNADLWVLPLGGNQKPFPFLQTQFNETDGHFSPDGRSVAYVSDESGRDEIYVRPFSQDSSAADASGAGAKWQVSYGGGQEPRWSSDGKGLYYLTLDWKVMEVDVTTSPIFQAGTAKLLFQAPPQLALTYGNYTADGKRFLFIAPTEHAGQAPFTVLLNWPSLLSH